MSSDWKKAQERVKKTLKAYEDTRKNFWSKEYVDTYQAQGNFVSEQPSDMWFLLSGHFGLIEIKTCSQSRFPFKDIRSSQFVGAMRVTAAGGSSRFLICKLPEWQWHMMPGEELVRMRREGLKSIGWNEMTPIKLTVEEIFHDLLALP